MSRILAVWRHRRRPSGHPRYSLLTCWVMNLIDRRAHCLYGCRWIAPYGFVRNAGCWIHD
jgi:hypothetical protein